MIPESFVGEAHSRLDRLLAIEGAKVDRYYYCPHHPRKGKPPYLVDCDCRKPKPGMLLTASREMNLDLSRSWLIGDKLSDLQAGAAAGCRTILVRTGHGGEVQLPANTSELRLEADVSSLAEAVSVYVSRSAV